ncbi:hypothetical protein V6x_12750 [Gimesia chilikensis]|uniref:Uncharacterized protein n=1 Tax=Gimesia chilikensis TaxID=2605989 RepID=A0A517W8N5_9PLAN|nr:hypothetical protein V6x_12750 [Gimesia chilikensis]
MGASAFHRNSELDWGQLYLYHKTASEPGNESLVKNQESRRENPVDLPERIASEVTLFHELQ